MISQSNLIFRINDKFSDVSKETLQDFTVDGINYYDHHFDGTVSASSSVFMSKSLSFSESMIGRSILIEESASAPTLIGGEYIISDVIDDNQVLFSRGNSLSPVVFDTSASDIVFRLAPAAGILEPILTDLKNSKISIFKTNCDLVTGEIGGVIYDVIDGEIVMLSGENIVRPQFRANASSRIVEFVGVDNNCSVSKTVDYTDPYQGLVFLVHLQRHL